MHGRHVFKLFSQVPFLCTTPLGTDHYFFLEVGGGGGGGVENLCKAKIFHVYKQFIWACFALANNFFFSFRIFHPLPPPKKNGLFLRRGSNYLFINQPKITKGVQNFQAMGHHGHIL